MLLALVVPTLAACGDEPDPCDAPVRTAVDLAGDRHHFVVDVIDVPSSQSEAEMLALDLDRDEWDRPDNKLGSVLGILGSFGDQDLDGEVAELMAAGEMLHLIEVQATSLEGADGVGVVIRHGVDLDGDPDDDFSGEETFAVDDSVTPGVLTGRIVDGIVSVEMGTAPIAVTFPGLEEPFLLRLVGARLEAQVTESGLSGRIAGGLPVEEIDGTLIPAMTEGLGRIVARDCPEGSCEPESFGELLLLQFDEDADGTIAEAELASASLTRSLLEPDLDLFDATGDYVPSCDGAKDVLSVGIGFRAVPARLAP